MTSTIIRLSKSSLVHTALLLVVVCGSGCSSTKEFGPDTRGENEVLELSIRKIQAKERKGRVRVWATLRNKTNETLWVNYGNFILEQDGRTYGGALRVPFVRVTKSFEMFPSMVKETPGPIEFLGVSGLKEGTLILNAVRVGSESAEPTEAIRVPFRMD